MNLQFTVRQWEDIVAELFYAKDGIESNNIQLREKIMGQIGGFSSTATIIINNFESFQFNRINNIVRQFKSIASRWS